MERSDTTDQTLDLLNAIVEALPVSVTVQAEDGRFVLVNASAAAQMGVSAGALISETPAAVLLPELAAQRRSEELLLTRSGKPTSREETVGARDGARTLLTSRQPVRVAGQTLILSTSVDITAQKQAERELQRLTYFDDLTGLPNRNFLQRRVEHAIETTAGRGRFALATLGIDNFKHINDYYGHAGGDALLIRVGQRISRMLRDTDMFARMTGDEFMLVLDPIDDEAQLHAAVSQVLQGLKEPFYLDNDEVLTSASIGVSVYPQHGERYETLRRNADGAMHRAKRDTKGNAVYFDFDIGNAQTARTEAEQRLRLAIRDNHFCCAFQPKVDLRTQAVYGFEALVRVRNEHGVIEGPGAFIGLATELGLIGDITRQVLAEIVDSLARLDEIFGPHTTVSLNVAAKQTADRNFMLDFVDALRETGIAGRLILELTEDAFIAKGAFQAEILPLIRNMDVGISIDDFGTGYSSLSALADITADEVKVDRSFITAIHQRPRSQSVLKAIESLCSALGMTVIAEGVETFEELAYLQAATGIRYGQGYYFAKPFFLDEVAGHKGPSEARPAQISRQRPEVRNRDTVTGFRRR
jgi:c-di-GMP phosphodiesterase Gmr